MWTPAFARLLTYTDRVWTEYPVRLRLNTDADLTNRTDAAGGNSIHKRSCDKLLVTRACSHYQNNNDVKCLIDGNHGRAVRAHQGQSSGVARQCKSDEFASTERYPVCG